MCFHCLATMPPELRHDHWKRELPSAFSSPDREPETCVWSARSSPPSVSAPGLRSSRPLRVSALSAVEAILEI